MQPTSISVVFRKQVSDGNYGSEVAEVTIHAELSEGEFLGGATDQLLTEARGSVHTELNQSPSMSVRRAIERQEPPRPAAPRQPVAEGDLEEIPF